MQMLGTHHLAITTSRFELLREFYVEKLGLPAVGGFPGHDIMFIAAGSITIELIGDDLAPDAGAPADPATGPIARSAEGSSLSGRARRQGWHHLAWEVEDVDAAFAELALQGVAIHSPPESFPPEAPSMRIAFLADPDGNLLELVQPLGSRYPHPDIGRHGLAGTDRDRG
jgi:catechol 2,3-dioxygenase-like lactoylglutathione lyase family enzyme